MGVLICIALFLLFQGVRDTDIDTNYLRDGLALEVEGKPEQALQLWEKAEYELDTPSLEIATEFLRVAAEYELNDYYESASSIYSWALSDSSVVAFQENQSELQQELSRLEPITDQEEFEEFQRLFEETDPKIFTELKKFWGRMDPTPATVHNERLIEHWQRIVYSREHFTREKDPPYGTDVRGEFYVRYGEPDKIEKGRVRITYDEIQTVLEQLIPNRSVEAKGGNNMDLMKVANQIQNLFVNPEYELWIYHTPGGEMTENMVLIFGHRSGGEFTRLQTLEDFIPGAAFTRRVQSKFDPGLPPVPAGMVLQWLYYEYFAKLDPYFSRLFSEYYTSMQRHIGMGVDVPPPPHIMNQIKQQNIVSSYQVIRRAPGEFSTDEKKIPSIPLNVYQYRLLDENNHPVFMTFLESRPLNAFLSDFMTNRDLFVQTSDSTQLATEETESFYELKHGVQIRNEDWELVGESQQTPELVFYPEETFISSVFVIPWSSEEVNHLYYAELRNDHPQSKPRNETIFDESLRGIGKMEIGQIEPLKVEPGKIVMSDLIIGYQKHDDSDSNTLLDFVVANDRQIPEGENLVVHFEVYQLQTDSTGFSEFEIEYEIKPKSGFLGWTKKQRDNFKLTLFFKPFGNRFKESLEIEAEGLEPDEYELIWKITDNQNGQSEIQSIDFEVFESNISTLSTSSVD